MIRFANENDINDIMSFIDDYWKKGHILGVNKAFFEYEHLFPEGVSYVISRGQDEKINAILGYIPYGKKNRDLMTVMWKANHTAHSSLGLELFKYLTDNGDIRMIASPGSNPKLKGLYKYFGYQFGKMLHWYRLRPQKTYQIARIVDSEIPIVNNSTSFLFLNSWEALKSNFDFSNYKRETKPYKEAWYIKKRYFNHPIYNYDVYGLYDQSEKCSLLMIFRIISVNTINVVRLIDCIGDFSLIEKSAGLIDYVLEKNQAEYVDCYEIGLSDDIMIKSGWKKREDSDNIIPNYFSPYLQENIDIYYFSSDSDVVLFKGDGDQDRPN